MMTDERRPAAAAAGGFIYRRHGRQHLEKMLPAATGRVHHLSAGELRMSHHTAICGTFSLSSRDDVFQDDE